jgi:TPR repeat protein
MNIHRILPLAAILLLTFPNHAASPQDKQEPSAAIKAILTDSEQGNASAQYLLGLAYVQGREIAQDYAAAVKWFRMAAEQGHAIAQLYMGNAYEIGTGIPREYSMALKWYRKAAEQFFQTAY